MRLLRSLCCVVAAVVVVVARAVFISVVAFVVPVVVLETHMVRHVAFVSEHKFLQEESRERTGASAFVLG